MHFKDRILTSDPSKCLSHKSNFERLKDEVKCLDREQFLVKGKVEGEDLKDFIVNTDFCSSKKVSVLDKYRQNIKKIHRHKPSNTFVHASSLSEVDYKPSFALKEDVFKMSKGNIVKKKETPQIIKKYYRPQSLRVQKQNIGKVK